MKALRPWLCLISILTTAIAFTIPNTAIAQQPNDQDLGSIVSDIEALTNAPKTDIDLPVIDDDPAPEEATDTIPMEEGAGEFISPEEFTTEVLRLEEAPAGPEPTTRIGESGEELISIALDNVQLEDVVRMFTRVSGANIIATSTNLEGTVTVNLVDVEWRPALTSILAMHNLSLVERIPGSGVYSIVPLQANAPVPLVVETLFLDYTTVKNVSPVLKTMLSSGGTISEFPSRNAMVIRSTEANLGEIKQILALIDIPGQQVCIETKFLELSDQASRKLGISWDSLDEFGVRLGAGPFTYERTVEENEGDTSTLSKWDNRNNVDILDKYYNVNNQQYEVVEDIKVTESQESEETFIVTEILPTVNITDTIDVGQGVTRDVVDGFTKTITKNQSAILEVDSFNMVLSALKKTEGVSVISNPKIIVANGEEGAFFSVGDREPIIRTELQSGTQDSPGDKITAELDTEINTEYIKEGYLSTGIELEVTPVIKSDSLIEAFINPSLRRKIGTKEVAGNEWPIISVKNIKTRFTLRDRQTVAIGGLTDTSETKKTSKIPFLGDIPLIEKYLFSHEADVKQQVETIIFVTLTLAQPDALMQEEGIPEQARLVHKKLLQNQIDLRQFKVDMDQMRQAIEAEEREDATKINVPDTVEPEKFNQEASEIEEETPQEDEANTADTGETPENADKPATDA
ncbi:MAG: hypothetical protein ISS35_02760 [Kiritimatiellae bacterium]|nr:hypothetical protein [Kiritimatiellia bacterium]